MLETESCFYDLKLRIFEDLKHSTKSEKRYILYAKSLENRILMVGFMIRQSQIRVITARPASGKERKIYEKEKN